MKKLPAPVPMGPSTPVLIAVDPASKSCGVAVFHLDGTPVQVFTLVSTYKNWGDRLFDMREQFESTLFLLRATHNYEVGDMVFERVPPKAHVGVPLVLGALLSAHGMAKVDVRPQNAVSPSTWKAWARKQGCPEKDPKGVAAVKSIFGHAHLALDSDDAADALMIGLSWFAKRPF